METKLTLIIAAMFFATQLSRTFPIFVLGSVQISRLARQWIGLIPIAILTDLIVSDFFKKSSEAAFHLNTPFVVAGFAAALAGYFSKNPIVATVVGIACVAGARVLGF